MIIHGDSLEILKTLEENSVDAVVTDPPYGWRFMGKAWDAPDIEKMAQEAKGKEKRLSSDGVWRKPRAKPAEAAGKYNESQAANKSFQLWTEAWAKEVLRVLKPGGHALIFCGPRTYHRMACGVEDAGFEIRDQLQWLFGSGFPKSHNIGNGIGTALKPANEPIVLARKPLSEKTVAKNVERWGTGALNIDGCRIGLADGYKKSEGGKIDVNSQTGIWGNVTSATQVQTQGRWPANLILDEEAAQMLDEKSGVLKTGVAVRRNGNAGRATFSVKIKEGSADSGFGDSGGASRFFQVIKQTEFDIESACQNQNDSLNAKPASEALKQDEALLNSVREAVKTNFKNDRRLLHYLGSMPDFKKCILTQSLALHAASLENIDTTEIIQSLLKSFGSAPNVTEENINSGNHANDKGLTRFLYQAKASKRERNAGLEGMPLRTNDFQRESSGLSSTVIDGVRQKGSCGQPNQNHHPTVKPIKLMEYLCRLITPPNGLILDPFCGSGSTGIAAKRLGFNFIGIERELEYVEIARKRIEHAAEPENDIEVDDAQIEMSV